MPMASQTVRLGSDAKALTKRVAKHQKTQLDMPQHMLSIPQEAHVTRPHLSLD